MRLRLSRRVSARYNWDRLLVSLWFAPLVMSIAGILLAWSMYWLDGLIPDRLLAQSRFILSGTPAQLSSALLNMGTTTLATAGVVFTLLTLPLSTVASQYGSRLLRVFLGDRTTQLVLGIFAGTAIYCLAAALTIPPTQVAPEGPQLTATVGLFLFVVSFGSLVLLVQHISTMLQAPSIAAAAGARLVQVVGAVMTDEATNGDRPTAGSQTRPNSKQAPDSLTIDDSENETAGFPIRVGQAGYIQVIDPDYALALARQKDLVIRLQRRPGHFVRPGVVIALVSPAGAVDEALRQQILRAVRIGNVRTPTQDPEYALMQLVEMGIRAMSPAINDPYTAMTCLDYIGEGLANYIRQGEPGSSLCDQDGRLRVLAEPIHFEELLSTAFDMYRHCSCDNARVLLHMLDVIDVIGLETKSPDARQQLAHQASLVRAEGEASRFVDDDRELLRRSSEALILKLSGAA